MVMLTFDATIAKQGDALIIRVPNALRLMAEPMRGGRVKVTIEEVGA